MGDGGKNMTRIKECLDRIGQTQKWLALTMGVKQPSVHDWITGKNKPTAANLERLSKIFHVSTDYLLGISQEKFDDSDTIEIEAAEAVELGNLKPDEIRLLNGYRSLNDDGKQYILQTLDTAVASNMYRQSDISMEKEA